MVCKLLGEIWSETIEIFYPIINYTLKRFGPDKLLGYMFTSTPSLIMMSCVVIVTDTD